MDLTVEQTVLTNKNYFLRSNENKVLVPERSRSKFGDLIFKNLCSKIVKKVVYVDFYGCFNVFKIMLYELQDEIVDIWSKNFTNLNNLLNFKIF